jgi:ABC-type amino acid transport substrate-binding protein
LNSVPVLVWSDSGRWTSYTQANMIIWPGDSLIVPSGYAALSGVNLRIAVVESAPFTMVEEITDDSGQITTKLIGYLPDLITMLEDQLEFTANITIFSSDQSYNGLIAMVANGTFDLMIADTTITSTRREIVAFSSPIFDNSLRVIVRDESVASIDFWSYLKPFSPQLWLTLAAATIYAGILICILERQKNEALQDRSIISSISMSMWYSIGTTLGYGVDFDVTTAAGRLLTIGLYILSLILVAAYTANLASDLSILKSKGVISGIDDIKNGKVPYSRIGILTGSSIEDYYLREISGGSRNFYPLNSKDEIFSLLLNKTIDASIMDSGVLEYETSSTYCNLTLPGTDFARSAFGIVFQKNWLYEKDLDVAILSIREAGTFDALKTKWFQTNGCSVSSDISTAMTIESMAGLFLTFAIISILAVFLFAWTKRFIIKKYLLTFEHIKRIL